jgi:O-antigen/teichoic acid export membrane protein
MEDATPLPPVQAPPARLRTDVFLTFGGKAATLVLGLLMVVVVARELGPSRQGLFAVAYSLTLILVQLGGLGLSSANPYFAAREPDQRARIVANSLWLAAGMGAVLVLGGAALRAVAPSALEGLGWEPLAVTLAGVPAALAALLFQSVLLGEGRMVAYNVVEIAHAAVTLAALFAALTIFGLGLTAALAVLTVSRYLATGVYLALLRHERGFGTPDVALVRRMLRYASRVYVALLASLLVIRLDLLLVNAFLGKTEAGLYSVAATLADGMFVLPMVVGLNLFPRVARGDPTQASAEVFRSVAVLFGLFCLATVPVAGIAVRTFFGDDYSEATDLYYWLLPGIFCLGMLTILSHHFAGRGYPPQAMAIWVGGLALNIALNLALLPGRGAWVAALTSSVTYGVLLVLHMRLFAKETGSYGALVPRPREVVRFVRVALSRG